MAAGRIRSECVCVSVCVHVCVGVSVCACVCVCVCACMRDGVESECDCVMTVSLHVLGQRVSWLRAGRDGSREETK